RDRGGSPARHRSGACVASGLSARRALDCSFHPALSVDRSILAAGGMDADGDATAGNHICFAGNRSAETLLSPVSSLVRFRFPGFRSRARHFLAHDRETCGDLVTSPPDTKAL